MTSRDRLINHYAHWVRKIVAVTRLPDFLDPQDYENSAMIGLIQAIDRYDPGCGYAFETFAAHRIRGAIKDELRHADFFPRTMRKAIKTYTDTSDEPSVTRALVLPGYSMPFLSLDAIVDFDGDEGRPLHEILTAPQTPGYEDAEEQELARRMIRGLPSRERLVMENYIYGGQTFQQIGDSLGVTVSRVSQIYAIAVRRLRIRYAAPRLFSAKEMMAVLPVKDKRVVRIVLARPRDVIHRLSGLLRRRHLRGLVFDKAEQKEYGIAGNYIESTVQDEIVKLLSVGTGLRQTARTLGIPKHTVGVRLHFLNEQRLAAGELPLMCPCGKPVTEHRGMCRTRLPLYPLRQAFLLERWGKGRIAEVPPLVLDKSSTQ